MASTKYEESGLAKLIKHLKDRLEESLKAQKKNSDEAKQLSSLLKDLLNVEAIFAYFSEQNTPNGLQWLAILGHCWNLYGSKSLSLLLSQSELQLLKSKYEKRDYNFLFSFFLKYIEEYIEERDYNFLFSFFLQHSDVESLIGFLNPEVPVTEIEFFMKIKRIFVSEDKMPQLKVERCDPEEGQSNSKYCYKITKGNEGNEGDEEKIDLGDEEKINEKKINLGQVYIDERRRLIGKLAYEFITIKIKAIYDSMLKAIHDSIRKSIISLEEKVEEELKEADDYYDSIPLEEEGEEGLSYCIRTLNALNEARNRVQDLRFEFDEIGLTEEVAKKAHARLKAEVDEYDKSKIELARLARETLQSKLANAGPDSVIEVFSKLEIQDKDLLAEFMEVKKELLSELARKASIDFSGRELEEVIKHLNELRKIQNCLLEDGFNEHEILEKLQVAINSGEAELTNTCNHETLKHYLTEIDNQIAELTEGKEKEKEKEKTIQDKGEEQSQLLQEKMNLVGKVVELKKPSEPLDSINQEKSWVSSISSYFESEEEKQHRQEEENEKIDAQVKSLLEGINSIDDRYRELDEGIEKLQEELELEAIKELEEKLELEKERKAFLALQSILECFLEPRAASAVIEELENLMEELNELEKTSIQNDRFLKCIQALRAQIQAQLQAQIQAQREHERKGADFHQDYKKICIFFSNATCDEEKREVAVEKIQKETIQIVEKELAFFLEDVKNFAFPFQQKTSLIQNVEKMIQVVNDQLIAINVYEENERLKRPEVLEIEQIIRRINKKGSEMCLEGKKVGDSARIRDGEKFSGLATDLQTKVDAYVQSHQSKKDLSDAIIKRLDPERNEDIRSIKHYHWFRILAYQVVLAICTGTATLVLQAGMGAAYLCGYSEAPCLFWNTERNKLLKKMKQEAQAFAPSPSLGARG